MDMRKKSTARRGNESEENSPIEPSQPISVNKFDYCKIVQELATVAEEDESEKNLEQSSRNPSEQVESFYKFRKNTVGFDIDDQTPGVAIDGIDAP